MRYFKVLKCPQSKVTQTIKRFKNKDGAIQSMIEYKEVKAGDGWWPGAYGHEKIKEGDILPIDGHLADKAANNTDFEEVQKPVTKKKAKKNAA